MYKYMRCIIIVWSYTWWVQTYNGSVDNTSNYSNLKTRNGVSLR